MVVRLRRLAVLFLALATLACGGGSPVAPVTPTPAPAPTPPGASVSSFNMSLLARLELGTLAGAVAAAHDEPRGAGALSGSGNWGYTSPDGRRFALTGISAGLSIVEVTDPSRPRNVALIAGAESQWREVKSYGEYVYVTTEANTGLDIVDMHDPDRPVKVQTWNRTFTSAHTLWIDAERGLLFANGTRGADRRASGMRVLSLEPDPGDPREVGSFTPFYIHDSWSRGSTLYASAINDGFVAILDVADPANIREVTRFFTGGRFTHNSWPTSDGRYLFTTDERAGRPLEAWDLRDPMAPRKVSEYIARPGTIPHNVMVDGDRLLVAHYVEGVHLLDVRDPERPSLLGFYDTYEGLSTSFDGVWGAYIFPGSDLILASDMSGGLFVIRSNAR
jgi:choice-of-anchor B domain-containing protein